MEWRLLQKLSARQMRVPQPVAARYCRHGMLYTADIITVRLRAIVSLSQYIAADGMGETFWRDLGAAIREFHAAGVHHADMNAYNLQIDKDGRLWMLDFDKGALRPPGPWQQQSLQRLQRSLVKIARLDPQVQFRAGDWEELLEGYFEASRSA
jgi:3-deoxy-D-manno-octulosonic acid kinase